LHLDDEVVFRVKNNSKTTIRVTSEGPKTLWAKTEKRIELPVDIRFGREYYIRCGVGMGAFVGRPKLEFVDNYEGKAQVEKITKERVETTKQNTNAMSQSTLRETVPLNENNYAESSKKEFKNIFRINIMETILSSSDDYIAINLQYARYINPKLAIPVDFTVATSEWQTDFVLLTGIEAVPFQLRKESGLLVSALVGIGYNGGYEEAGFVANANIGYQLITKKGFTFYVAGGPMYSTLTEKYFIRAILSVGYAF